MKARFNNKPGKYSASKELVLLSFLLLSIFCAPFHCYSQAPSTLPAQQYTEVVPEKLLSTRSVVIFSHSFQQSELDEIQKAFQQIGIDAIAYFEMDQVLAGKDVTKAFAEYFVIRQITYTLLIEKLPSGFQITGSLFSPSTLFDPSLPAWRLKKEKLSELLRTVFQDSWRSQKKQNFLVNESPELDIKVDPIKGNRQEFYAIDLKVDNLAVPKFGNEAMDKELEQIFQANYPLKYKITEAGVAEQELRRQGYAYVLCYVHTRGKAAREVLGYDMSKAGTTYASITFTEGQLQLKTISDETEIYKFYFRHIDNKNVFLGTKWDADITWQDALRNHINGFKLEAKLN